MNNCQVRLVNWLWAYVWIGPGLFPFINNTFASQNSHQAPAYVHSRRNKARYHAYVAINEAAR